MLLNFCGFEDNNPLEISYSGSYISIQPTSPRTGTYALRCGGANINAGWIAPVGIGEFYFQFAIKQANPNDNDICFFRWVDATGNTMGGFWVLTGGVFNVYTGNKITLIGSTAAGLTSSWAVIEGYIKIDPTDGRVVVKVDGATQVDFTGNTQPGAATEVGTIRGHAAANSYNFYSYYDDIIINDTTGTSFNSWPMGIKCHKVAAPLANGNYHAWTPSAGQNFECIDETPPSMDDYVEGTVGQKDSYPFGDAPVGLSGIAGVVVRYYGQGNGDIKRLCRLGGVDYLSDAFTVPGTFNKVDDVMPEKPGGGGWDEATFNACEFGMEHQ